MNFVMMLFTLWLSSHVLIVDEPDHNGIPPSAVQIAYQTNRYERPNDALWITIADCTTLHRYAGSFDRFAVTAYVWYWGFSAAESHAEWLWAVKYCVGYARAHHLRPPLMLGQDFGGVRDGPFSWRCPTRGERRYMIDTARRYGAAGILWYRIKGHECRYL